MAMYRRKSMRKVGKSKKMKRSMGTRRKHKKGRTTRRTRTTRRGGVKAKNPSPIRMPTNAEKRAFAATADGKWRGELDRRGQDVLLHGSLLSPMPETAAARNEKIQAHLSKGFGDAVAAAAARKAEEAQLMD